MPSLANAGQPIFTSRSGRARSLKNGLSFQNFRGDLRLPAEAVRPRPAPFDSFIAAAPAYHTRRNGIVVGGREIQARVTAVCLGANFHTGGLFKSAALGARQQTDRCHNGEIQAQRDETGVHAADGVSTAEHEKRHRAYAGH